MGWGRRAAAWLIPLALSLFGLFWPLVFTGPSQPGDPDDPYVRMIPTVTSVSMDGEPIQYEMLWVAR